MTTSIVSHELLALLGRFLIALGDSLEMRRPQWMDSARTTSSVASSHSWRGLVGTRTNLILLSPRSGCVRIPARPTPFAGRSGPARDVEDVELLHQLHPVVFDRLGAELEDERDGLGGLALGNELEDLALPLGQLFDRAAGAGDLLQWKFIAKTVRDFAAQIDFAAHDALQGRFQLGHQCVS
jgi:hypothetical protein